MLFSGFFFFFFCLNVGEAAKPRESSAILTRVNKTEDRCNQRVTHSRWPTYWFFS